MRVDESVPDKNKPKIPNINEPVKEFESKFKFQIKFKDQI
jgi:hypothetical protein